VRNGISAGLATRRAVWRLTDARSVTRQQIYQSRFSGEFSHTRRRLNGCPAHTATCDQVLPAGGPAIKVDTIAQGAYPQYLTNELGQLNPPMNEMIKIGLWIELDVAIAFLVGLGFGSLVGQRTVVTIVMIAVEIIVTPILASATIPYFLNGQRLFFGVAMDQLRPAGLASDAAGPTHHGAGGVLFGGHAVLQIPPMPTWAMIAVIAGSIVAWTGIGAWRMATRDA
jgi:hypothetical protein